MNIVIVPLHLNSRNGNKCCMLSHSNLKCCFRMFYRPEINWENPFLDFELVLTPLILQVAVGILRMHHRNLKCFSLVFFHISLQFWSVKQSLCFFLHLSCDSCTYCQTLSLCVSNTPMLVSSNTIFWCIHKSLRHIS